MLLSSALKQVLNNPSQYYLQRSTWSRGQVVYVYRPLAAVLLNQQFKHAHCSEEQRLIKENLLSASIEFAEYKPCIKDLLAEDWSVLEKEQYLRALAE